MGRREGERGNNVHTRQGKGNLHLILNCPPGLLTAGARGRTEERKIVTLSCRERVCSPLSSAVYPAQGRGSHRGSYCTLALLQDLMLLLGDEGRACPVIKLFQKDWIHHKFPCLFTAGFLDLLSLNGHCDSPYWEISGISQM